MDMVKLIITAIMINLMLSMIPIASNINSTEETWSNLIDPFNNNQTAVDDEIQTINKDSILQQGTPNLINSIVESIVNIVVFVGIFVALVFSNLVTMPANAFGATTTIELIMWTFLTLLVYVINFELAREFYYVIINRKASDN